MITVAGILVVGAALCGAGPAMHPVPHAPPPRDSLERVYQAAQTWDAFFAGADTRRALWVRNWQNASVPANLSARARIAGGSWRILVITDATCSDAVNSVPYIAKLVEEIPGLELRIARADAGRPWMEAHRAPDGRAATPTVLVLDGQYAIRGCWIEQPAKLQEIWLPVVARGRSSQELSTKMQWYEADEGRETLREIVEVLEGAASGKVHCPGLADQSAFRQNTRPTPSR